MERMDSLKGHRHEPKAISMQLDTILLVTQVAATGAICATFWIYYRQLRVMEKQLEAMKKTAQSQSLLETIKYISDPELKEARKVLISHRGKSLSTWTGEAIAQARKVCVSFDIVEVLIKNEVIPKGVIESHWRNSIILCREVAEELISLERANHNPVAWQEFDALCSRAREGDPN
jgi:hypothetical protein